MDEETIRDRATEFCEAIVAGNVDRAAEAMSDELRRNLGEVVALLPLPAGEAVVQSVERGGAGFNVILRMVGETDEVELQTRWKDRDGEPTMVEASHLSKTARPEETLAGGEESEETAGAA